VGAVRGVDPTTGFNYDDTKRYIDASALSAGDKKRIFEENAYRVYPRLKARLNAGVGA
jgi:4-oxalmesaconate hydratase